jgi:hypothetical protein
MHAVRLLRWSSAAATVALGLLGALGAPTACNGASAADGGEGGDEADGGEPGIGPNDAAEPVVCTEFTKAGEPCATPSPVRCFPECEAGGCSCTASADGPRWTCVSDFSCMPDCAPLDDGCSPTFAGEPDAVPD